MKPWIKIIIGLVLGVIAGLAFGHKVEFLERIGKAFIDLLKMLVGLMVFSSLVVGMCHISDPKKLGRIGIRTIFFYAGTTALAIGFGLLLAFVMRPGSALNLPIPPEHLMTKQTVGIVDFLFGIVPSNPFAAFAEGNILQIIVFSIFFAFAITLTGEKGKKVLNVLESLSEVMYSLTHFIMKIAPYGVFALIATAVGDVGTKVLYPLLKFLACNYIACLLQILVVFCLALRYMAKLRVAPFFKGMKDAIVLAFTTSSSSATLPVSLDCARNHLGISPDISGFVLSLGSTINMNGAAVGQAISAIFIAQAYGIEVTVVKVLILIFVSLVSAIGAAGIPGTGIVMLSVVLNAMGLPLEGIALVAGVDRLREMVSAVVNVLGDAVAAVFIAKTEKQIDEKRYHAITWLE
ncbi:cation:dicarboxylate symporter family transporter [Candidatus Neptunochlamydia vexilliferae]|uniref:Proton/sodium-glutamate symport protein n=1 Tax=Candidatus Neptunichlamydia vexilliferae TaxID=1651774 RepID=A0ABS0B2M9_9BACT|nr:dicarboxylate/amino acid:cation symporter [Candidatus Neptunochlamydia vexilliferae]MBF5059815.1 Proton/sodium-glutamate symport protein [Candidatus Neptunochlamydia vexilliferae]